MLCSFTHSSLPNDFSMNFKLPRLAASAITLTLVVSDVRNLMEISFELKLFIYVSWRIVLDCFVVLIVLMCRNFRGHMNKSLI